MFKKPHFIALAIVLVLTVIALNLPGGPAARLKHAMGGLFLPLFGLADSTRTITTEATERLLPRSELIRQNEDFRKENQQLRIQLLQAEAVTRENDRLHQLLAWQARAPWKLKLARVVLREPANWWRTVTIDVGSRDEIRKDMPVLTPDGLVGRVDSVSLTQSRVVLLGDRNCKVSVRVQNQAGDVGVILAPDSIVDSSLVELSYLSRSAVLEAGQEVYTSGLGGVFPKGIPVGKIEDFHTVEYDLYTKARVRLAANLSSLDEVWVLLP